METPGQAIRRRLMRLGRRDEKLQIRMIALSLEIAKKMEKDRMDLGHKRADFHKETMGKEVSREQLLSICEMLSELILENMYEDEEGDFQVLSIDLSEQCRSKIRRVSRYFYEGIAGIIVFLYALEKEEEKSHKENIKSREKARIRKKAADRLLAQLKEYTENLDFSGTSDDIQEHVGRTGMFDGEYSIVFAYLLLYEIQEEDEYLWFAEMHAKKSFPLIQQDCYFDLIGGNAGAIIVLLKLFDITEKEEYLQMAVTAGEILCGQAEKMECGIGWRGAEKTALCGMAHGNSGILVAMCRLYQKTKDKKFYDICLQGLAYEDSMYDETVHDWKDLREESGWQEDINGQRMAWCHGRGGITLARKHMLEALEDGTGEDIADLCVRLEKEIRKISQILSEKFWREELCVCHGTFGNYRILKKLGDYLDKGMLDTVETKVYEQVICLGKKSWISLCRSVTRLDS